MSPAGPPTPAAEPIAVVGMSCRFPGDVDSPSDYWRMLLAGREAGTPVPEDRWNHYTQAGPGYAGAVRELPATGGFRERIHDFDAEFFGISPREAALMDPQQRMVLELAWEALEHAGIPPHTLAGGNSGVYVGVNTDDHGRAVLEDLPRIEAWTGIGASLCAVANRVSHALDLRGPSMAVETACSASLVAIHLACQSLRLGETPLALAGGVMLMVAPGLSLVMRAAGALSPDGRCKAFDASADGYARGEGAGLLVLKRLRDARRAGDRVHAVIRGSAVRQDGRTDGIMAPNVDAQVRVLRSACEQAGVDPGSVDYVEAHGTGTSAGDPVEARALASVYGAHRPPGRPCLIGSVKSNIGHLEAASGIAGVIKAVLALRHGTVPASLHLTRPNPAVRWDAAGLRVVTETTRWPRADGPRRAAVSGYGYGGTIAHLVLEQAPQARFEAVPTDHGSRWARVYPLSGASESAVRDAAARLARRLDTDGGAVALADVAHTLARRRTHLPMRAAVVAADREDLVRRLTGLAESGSAVRAEAGRGPVWVFAGQGSQWPGMGLDLLEPEPAFRDTLERITPVLRVEYGQDARSLLTGHDDEWSTPDTQVAIVVTQLALSAVWRHYGVRPAAVIGHSVGEVAAAAAAGALTEEDAVRLVCRRSRLLRRVAGTGGMAMVGRSAAELAGLLHADEKREVAVAVLAAPDATVVSGAAAVIKRLVRRLRDDDIPVRPVATDIAFHSPGMDPLRGRLRSAAIGLGARPPEIPLYTTVLDDARAEVPRDGDYWAANLRRPVRFGPAVEAALADGHRLFLEVSPHPVVSHSIEATARAVGAERVTVTHTLRRGKPGRTELLTGLALLHCHGTPVDWRAVHPGGELTELPTTAWQHREYRVRTDVVPPGGSGARPHDPDRHSLLGGGMTVHGTVPVRCWRTVLDESSRPYPGRHPVLDTEIVPAAVLLTTFADAAPGEHAFVSLRDVSLRGPVPVQADGREVQVTLMDGALRLSSRRARTDDDWLTHTTARSAALPAPGGDFPLADWCGRCPEHLDPGHVVDRLGAAGVAGMGFDWRIDQLRRGEGELLAHLRVGDEETATPAPALDAALSLAAVAMADSSTLRMPAHVRAAAVPRRLPSRLWVRVCTRSHDTVDIRLGTPGRGVLAELTGVRYRELVASAPTGADTGALVHRLTWRPRRPGTRRRDVRTVVLVRPRHGTSRALRSALIAVGVRCLTVSGPEELDRMRGRLDDSTAVLVEPDAAAGTGRAAGIAAYQATWLLLRVLRSLDGGDDRSGPRLWVLTRGVLEAGTGTALGHSALWGTGRVLGSEHPGLWGGVVDLPGSVDTDPAATASALLAVLRGGPGESGNEDVVAVRDGTVLVPRLAPVSAPAGVGLRCRPEGTYLITGGLGALGREVARWLAERGARRLVLAARRGLPARDRWDDRHDPETTARIDAVRDLEHSGVTVRTLELDITDRVQAAKLLSPEELGLQPITGVVHAAGALDNRLAREVDARSLRTVLRPKVAGALLLHELFPPKSLEFFALFSSAGPLLGLPGQAAYAAANSFLDALARHRRSLGDRATTSLSWTSWRGLGMSTSSASIDAELAARGTAAITAEEALRSWDHAWRSGADHVAVLRTVAARPGVCRPPLLAELARPEAAGTATTRPWHRLRGAELTAFVTDEVAALVADELRLPPAELDRRCPLAELGVDSVLTQTIRARLERCFEISLPATLLWNRPTVSAIADHVAELLAANRDEQDPAQPDVTGRSK